jgi:hypothetical protein
MLEPLHRPVSAAANVEHFFLVLQLDVSATLAARPIGLSGLR